MSLLIKSTSCIKDSVIFDAHVSISDTKLPDRMKYDNTINPHFKSI